MKKQVFIWGFMGVGKTRFAEKLSASLQIPWMDLDREIEARHDSSISELFEAVGEDAFREYESDMLSHIIEDDKNLIVSCGGGCPCFHDNAQLMLDKGLVISLYCDSSVLVKRLERNLEQRPLLSKFTNSKELLQFIELKSAERKGYYSLAHLEYDNTFPDQSIQPIIDKIEAY